jgi:hypothetical protein
MNIIDIQFISKFQKNEKNRKKEKIRKLEYLIIYYEKKHFFSNFYQITHIRTLRDRYMNLSRWKWEEKKQSSSRVEKIYVKTSFNIPLIIIIIIHLCLSQ